MCSIIASFNGEKLKDLYKLNSYRGQLSYSFSVFRPLPKTIELRTLCKDTGELPYILVDKTPKEDIDYLIAHSQAPTTQSNNIHPAVFGDAMLWHNGIIKQKEVGNDTWDTLWLLEKIIDYGWSSLSRIDGTFACMMYWGGELFVFRNEISPLFIDTNLNISSTKFDNSESIEPGIVHKIDLVEKKLIPVAYFKTFENPYYIPE